MSSNENPVTPAPAGDVDRVPASETAPGTGPAPAEGLQNVTQRDTSATDCLTVKQLQALDRLLYGETDAAIAQTLEVSRMTLWRWQTQHAPFKAELARRRRLIWNTTADRYRRLLLKTADVLERQLNQNYDVMRFKAACAVLRMSGRIAPVPEPEPDAAKPE